MYGDTYSLASYEVEVDGLAHDGSDVEANGTSWMLTRYHAGKAMRWSPTWPLPTASAW